MKSLLTTFALGALLLLPACSESSAATKQEAAMQETVGLMDEMADEFAKMKDSETAKAGMVRVEKIIDDLAAVMEGVKDLGEPAKELKRKFEPQLEAAQQKMTQAMMSMMMNPQVQQVLTELQAKMKKLEDVMPK